MDTTIDTKHRHDSHASSSRLPRRDPETGITSERDSATPGRVFADTPAALGASEAQLSGLDSALLNFRQVVAERTATSVPHRARMEQSFGADFGGVKAHLGQPHAMASIGAHAAASGETVVFGDANPDPWLVAHELAHVVQARRGGAHSGTHLHTKGLSEASDAAEVEADQAADAVIRGERPIIQQSISGGIHRFGATAKRNKTVVESKGQDLEQDRVKVTRDRTSINHENQTLAGGEAAGMSPQEAQEVYSGNWQRDMNQALLGGSTKSLNPAIFELMGILHGSHFGPGLQDHMLEVGTNAEAAQNRASVPLNAGEFGSYDPVEHIDNPAGLLGSDVLKQTNDGTPEGANPSAGKATEGFAAADERYAEVAAGLKNVSNPRDFEAFQVDESGLPVYMQLSRRHMEALFSQSAAHGPQLDKTGAERGRGARKAGEATHILQDYFAHSNFCEIALNILIEQGDVAAQGRLDSQAHHQRVELGDDKDAQGNRTIETYQATPERANARVGQGKQRREVMATGTFIQEDTGHSIAAKVKDAIDAIDPFANKGKAPNPLMVSIFDWADQHLTDEGGRNYSGAAQLLSEGLDELIGFAEPVIEAAGPHLGRVGQGAAKLTESMTKRAAAVATEAVEKGNETLGTDLSAEKVAGGIHASGQAVKSTIEATTVNAVPQARALIEKAKALQQQLSQEEHLLATLYAVGWDTLAEFRFAALVKSNESLYKRVKAKEDAIRARIRETIEATWKKTVKAIHAYLDAAVESATEGDTKLHEQGQLGTWAMGEGVAEGRVEGATMREGGRSLTYAAPTHTDIAKDFDPAKESGHGHHHGHGAGHDHDHDHGGHDRHAGAWLAPLANLLATAATKEALGLLKTAWHGEDAASRTSAAEELKKKCSTRWFSHPADNADFWKHIAIPWANTPANRNKLLKRVEAGR